MACNNKETTLSLVTKRILIADDHLAVREGLRSLIDPDPDFKVVGEAADGNEAARKALELRPDVIMLDNSMPGMTGLEVARMLRDALPATKIVFLTLDPGIRDLALATGAAAHISKDQPPQEIMRVVRAAAGLSTPKATAAQPASAQAKLAELLISEKAITARQIQDLDKSRDAKQTLSNAILRSGLVVPEALAGALARVTGHPLTSLRVAPQPPVGAARANLTVFQGAVQVRHGSGGYAAASTNDLVQQGDTIRTAAGGHAALTFFDRSIIVLEPDTEVVIETLHTVAGGRDIDLVLRQLMGGTWNVVAHSIGEGGRYEVVTPTSTNTVQGTAFQVTIDEKGLTTVSTVEGTVRTFGLNTAVPPVLVSAGMQTTIGETGPSAAQPIRESTLTFTFGDAGQAFVVNGAGQSAGVQGGNVVRFIPGSVVAQGNNTVAVTIPGEDAGRMSAVVAPNSDIAQVRIATELVTPDGKATAVTETRPVQGGTAKGGVTVTGTQVVVLSDAAAKAVPAPVLASPPPSPTPFNPITLISGGSHGDLGPAGPVGLNGEPGAQGPPGPVGPTGPAGASGDPGSSGAPGVAGTTGAAGSAGATGAAGADGVPGATGAPGAQGTAGAAGPTGVAGPAGPSGVGPTGPAGPTGANGLDGATGPAGANGAGGPTGATGANGANGVDGATGATGANGG